ncbi:MAG TPA: DNA-3-methyladenine glycosylase [Perlabentimonas sp.]|nr:DNA-3-methyladenine glycosylase [Bacteroidales bacterium]MDD4672261.1 DNA-3-methyladenine glycosylase [Bacteroidales bacterium]HZJ73219.1 DNA-3-methyladenine glycosylase [Perlabentimonas sp.]
MNRLTDNFFKRDVLVVAPQMVGKILVRRFDDGQIVRLPITEVEAYRGEDDLACHASKGRTPRTDVMYSVGGCAYVYLVYGMHWMLNIVTGDLNSPQAVLLRGVDTCYGPGRLTRLLKIDKSFNAEDFTVSERLWFEQATLNKTIDTGPRIGVDYAGDYWALKPWRYWIDGLHDMTRR